jgi:hypothetical protein
LLPDPICCIGTLPAGDANYSVQWKEVKHRLVSKAHDWPWYSFHRYVGVGYYDADWGEGIEKNSAGRGRIGVDQGDGFRSEPILLLLMWLVQQGYPLQYLTLSPITLTYDQHHINHGGITISLFRLDMSGMIYLAEMIK